MESGFNAIGKPIPEERKQAAYDFIKDLDITEAYTKTALVNRVTNELEKDKPYTALKIAQEYLDFTGSARLLAILLTD